MSAILTQEDINFLKELANELKTQDTSCTAKPVYYTIMQKDKEYGIDSEYADGMCVIGDEGEIFTETKDLIEFIINNYSPTEEQQLELNELDDLEEIYDYCDGNKIVDSLNYTGYRDIEIEKEVFITKKSLKEHLECNGYHYKNNPVSYARHIWRNPQFSKLLDIVEKFADVEEVKGGNSDGKVHLSKINL